MGEKASLLTPDLQRKLEVLLNELMPGDTVDEAYTHEGEEFGFVLEGQYEVTVGDEVYVLDEGDSISYPSHLPHKMRVVGDRPSRSIWVITPPSF
jgi:quercetin dioxygenase-like cupin family protein